MSLLHEQVYQLYFSKGKTQREIAEELEVKRHIIIAMFKEKGWEARPSAPRREEVNPDDIYKLYFQEDLSQREVAEKLGLSSTSPIQRIFEENGWESRGRWGKGSARTHYSTDEERKIARKERSEKRQQQLKEMRNQLFGIECKICGTSNEERTIAIHRKDFTEHKLNKLWLKGELESVDTEEWVALCVACHRGIHWLKSKHGIEWENIENCLEKKDGGSNHMMAPFELAKKEADSSESLERISIIGEDIEDLRKSIFGEECHFCGKDYENRRLAIHRKDGRAHRSSLLWSERNLKALNPDEWIALCQKCHRYVHWAEDILNLNCFNNA